MKFLIFSSRIALICNICFIVAEILRYSPGLRLNDIYSTIVVLGYISILLNLLLAVTVLVLFASRKRSLNSFPRWLLITNFLFLTVQIFIFLS